MNTCGTSTSPPSSVQQVGWRDRLDLQHNGVVYMVENFCSRASPTDSREGERKGSRAARVGGEGVGGGAPQPSLYRGVGRSPSPSPKPKPAAPKDKEWGARKHPLLEALSRV